MNEVRLISWQPGLKTVSLIVALQEDAKQSLSQAKRLVDSLLEGKSITLLFESRENADAFTSRVKELGVIIE